MNKQEAIEFVENISYSVPINSSVKYLREETVVDIIKQLDEPERPPEPEPLKPEKPVVPQFVADWYEKYKNDFEYNLYRLCINFHERKLHEDLHEWFKFDKNKPIETLILMHKFGYEVEKEKLYTARFKASNEYLNLDKNYEELLHFRVPKNVSERCNNYHFTKEKLVEYSVWDTPAYEIEEVE